MIIHLRQSPQSGRRTACGRILNLDYYITDNPDIVNCERCTKTHSYKLAKVTRK